MGLSFLMKTFYFLLLHKPGIKIRHILEPLALILILNRLKASVGMHAYIYRKNEREMETFFYLHPKY